MAMMESKLSRQTVVCHNSSIACFAQYTVGPYRLPEGLQVFRDCELTRIKKWAGRILGMNKRLVTQYVKMDVPS